MCRKFHGAAYGTLVGVNWLQGFNLLKGYQAGNGTFRTFCRECGSSLGFRVKGASINEMEMATGTFDDDIPVTIDAQIYAHYKANWCQLQHDMTTFLEGRAE